MRNGVKKLHKRLQYRSGQGDCLDDLEKKDRFDIETFQQGLRDVGLEPVATEDFIGVFAWFVARKPGDSDTIAGSTQEKVV